MTLGGIALAVGMLVDDATVEIENIHRNHAMGKPLLVAILDGASQIATPTFVGTLSICIVFFPVVLLTGVARFLFTPLALAVVFAMLTSYLLSRTLVPTMARTCCPTITRTMSGTGCWGTLRARRSSARFERVQERYRAALASFIARRGAGADLRRASWSSLRSRCCSIVGEDFFPTVDAGMMRLHVRAPTGTRIEQTERICRQHRARDPHDHSARRAGEHQRQHRPAGLLRPRLLPDRQYRPAGRRRADPAQARASADRDLPGADPRRCWRRSFPNVTTYFQAADIVSQVLNFGLPAAIDVQITGNDLQSDYDIALRLKERMARIPGVTDLRIAEPLDYPGLQGRRRSRQGARSSASPQQQVASSLLTSLSGAQLAAAELLARSGQRRQLQRHRADAAASGRLGRARLANTPLDARRDYD